MKKGLFARIIRIPKAIYAAARMFASTVLADIGKATVQAIGGIFDAQPVAATRVA